MIRDHAQRLRLPRPQRVGVAQRRQRGGLVTDQLVEPRQVHRVPGRLQPGRAREVARARVPQLHVPPVLAALLPLPQQLGVEPRDRLRHHPLDQHRPTRVRAGPPARRPRRPRPPCDRPCVAWATLRAFHGATSSASTRAQIRGMPVLQVQRIGQQLHPGHRGDPERRRERLRGERRHQRCALPAQRLVVVPHPRQPRVAPGRDPGVRGGRVQHTPLRRQPQLAPLGLPRRGLLLRRAAPAASPRRAPRRGPADRSDRFRT